MKRILTGQVVSNRGEKTLVVQVDRLKTHPIYRKKYSRSKRFYAHDEKNKAQVGDTVEIIETIPISKTKNWKLKKVVETAPKAKGSAK